MLRSPRRRQAESRRQKALGSPKRVAKIDKALAAGPDLSDEQEKAAGNRNGGSLRILSTGNFTRCAGRCCNEPAAGAW